MTTRATERGEQQREALESGLAAVEPLLAAEGFEREGGGQGASSGGSYAAVTFRRGDLTIGLIVRYPEEFGCPNYSYGQGKAGHDDILWALGLDSAGRLVRKTYLQWAGTNDESAFSAFASDLRDFVIPVLRRSDDDFRQAVAKAHQRSMDRLFGRVPPVGKL